MTEQAFPVGSYILLALSADRGLLMGMPFPRPETLANLPDLGVNLVVSLVESQFMTYTTPDCATLRLAHFAIDDGKTPAEVHMPRIALLCALMHQCRRQGIRHGVAVHCQGGQGRTGLLNTAYRAYLREINSDDMDGQEIDITVREIERHLAFAQCCPGLGPNPYQTRWVQRFVSFLRNNADPTWDAWAREELTWQCRADETASAWYCSNCRQAASSKISSWTGPIWCPNCGKATGNRPSAW